MRTFTPDEANAELPHVRALAERLVEGRRRLAPRAAELAEAQATAAGNGGGLDSARLRALQEELEAGAQELAGLVKELTDLGVQVKDLDEGLIDFPAVHPESGETVLLCWRVGEAEVGWWHDLEEGFAGRKPLPF